MGKYRLMRLFLLGISAFFTLSSTPILALDSTRPSAPDKGSATIRGSAVRPAAYYGMTEAPRSERLLRDIMLTAHNEERRRYGIPALEWDPALAADAARYAGQMAQSNIFRHSMKSGRAKPSGENLWMGPRRLYSYEVMVGSFLDERKYFRSKGKLPDFSTSGRWQDVGHYTQMIWRGTRKLGCALGDGQSYEYLVCRYFPAGNVYGMGPFDAEDSAEMQKNGQY